MNNYKTDSLKNRYNIYKRYYLKNKKNLKLFYFGIINRIKLRNKIINYFILYNLIEVIVSIAKINYFSNDNYITLKIKKGNNLPIYYNGNDVQCDSKSTNPNYVYINNVQQSEFKYKYDFVKDSNTVKLVWNNKIKTSTCMFYNCIDITEIDLSHFDTSEITNMYNMFRKCSSLQSIDFTNAITSKVEDMHRLFNECPNLISLDLSYFDTSNVKGFYYMFDGCTSLKSLDISNFDTKKGESFDDMFKSCNSLEYINLENTKFDDNLYSLITGLISNKLIICSRYNKFSQNSQLKEFINCNINNNAISNDYKCYKKTSNSQTYNCEKCGNNYYKIENDPKNTNSYLNCYQSAIGYYRDNSIFKSCYSTCKTCDKGGTESIHNCNTCNDNFNKFSLIFESHLNCYNDCPYYYYIDLTLNKKICTESMICPDNYNKLIANRKECIDDCNRDNIYKYEYNDKCIDTNPYIYTTELIKIESTIIIEESSFVNKADIINTNYTDSPDIIISYLKTSEIVQNNNYENNSYNSYDDIILYLLHNHNKTDILFGNDLEIAIKDILYALTTTDNQRNNMDKNRTAINIGKCENTIKFRYNISLNDTLYIIKIDKNEEGMKIPKIEYELYYPLYNNELIKLNLTECKNTKVEISIPIKINDKIEKYNSSSNFYNNICSKTTSNYGTDISLKDRKEEFIKNNMTLCEEDCDLIEYDEQIEKAKCSCLIKITLPMIDDIKFDKKKLYKNFIDINNIANIQVLKCYREVFKLKSLKRNYGFFIYSSIIVLFIITFFLFYCKNFSLLKILITKMSEAKLNVIKIEKNNINNILTNHNNRNINRKVSRNKNDIKIKGTNKKVKFKKNIIKGKMFPPIKLKNVKRNNNYINLNNTRNKIPSVSNRKIKFKTRKTTANITTSQALTNNNKNYKKYKEILKYNDNEMNSLEYEKAITIDKRTYFEYYLSLLRIGHLFIFSFYSNNNDYNVQIIKIFLFFFFFSVHLIINALFFLTNINRFMINH